MVNLSINLNKAEATNMWSDITKFLTVAIIIHLLLYAVDDYGELFDENVLKLLLYMTMGFVIYHLIIKKSIDKYLNKENVQEAETKETKEVKKEVKKPIIKSERKNKKKDNKKENKKVRFNV